MTQLVHNCHTLVYRTKVCDKLSCHPTHETTSASCILLGNNLETVPNVHTVESQFNIFTHFRLTFLVPDITPYKEYNFSRFEVFPAFKRLKFGPYNMLEPQFKRCIYNLEFWLHKWHYDFVQCKGSDLRIHCELMQQCTSVLKSWHRRDCPKAYDWSNVHIIMFLTKHCYWLITNHGYKLPEDGS